MRSIFSNLWIPGTGAVGIHLVGSLLNTFIIPQVSCNLVLPAGVGARAVPTKGICLDTFTDGTLGTVNTNGNTFIGTIIEGLTGSGIGLDFISGRGNAFKGGSVEGCNIGVKYGTSTSDWNEINVWFEGNTTDISGDDSQATYIASRGLTNPNQFPSMVIGSGGTQILKQTMGIVSIPRDGSTVAVDWPHGIGDEPTTLLVTPWEAQGIDFHSDYLDRGPTNFKVTIPTAIAASYVQIDYAVADDGGVQTDETTAARNATTDDMTLLPAVPAVDDAYYFAHWKTFSAIKLKATTAGVGTWTIVWEYYATDGTWQGLGSVSDATNGFTTADAATGLVVSWTVPSDWAKTSVGGHGNLHWIRARVGAYTNVTTQPLGDLVYYNECLHYDFLAMLQA
jgi:hypothetical protein